MYLGIVAKAAMGWLEAQSRVRGLPFERLQALSESYFVAVLLRINE